MTAHIPEEFSTRLIGWSPFVIMGNTMPPRDPRRRGRRGRGGGRGRRRRIAGRARAGRRLEHDAFRIEHSVGNSWRIRWAKNARKISPIVTQMVSAERAAALRNKCLNLAKTRRSGSGSASERTSQSRQLMSPSLAPLRHADGY